MFSQSKTGSTVKFGNDGYTLIELLLVLGLFAILMILAIPGYQSVKAMIETRLTLSRLITLIHYARSEAIRTGHRVIICKSIDGKTCSGDWSDGQIVFMERKNPRILLFAASSIKFGKLYFRAFQSSDFLRFTPNGTTFEQNGSFVYYPDKTNISRPAWTLMVEKSGRLRVV